MLCVGSFYGVTAQAQTVSSSPIQEYNVFGVLQGKVSSPSRDPFRGYLELDFLYWLPKGGGLEYAFIQDSPASAGGSMDMTLVATIQNGTFKRVDFEWTPGFRFEGGMRLPLDGWDLYGKWTRLVGDMSGSSSISTTATENIAPIWLGAGYKFSGYEKVLQASASWDLHYNTVNLALMKSYFSSKRLLLALHTGLQGAWIDQEFQALYRGGTLLLGPASFNAKNNFRSAGLFSALDMGWYLSKHWKILSRFQGSVNFGWYQISQATQGEINDETVLFPDRLRNGIDQSEKRTRFAYEAGLGIEWEYAFRHKQRVALRAMYDLVEWVHLNQMRRFTYSDTLEDRYFFSTNGSLGFQGISLAAKFDF